MFKTLILFEQAPLAFCYIYFWHFNVLFSCARGYLIFHYLKKNFNCKNDMMVSSAINILPTSVSSLYLIYLYTCKYAYLCVCVIVVSPWSLIAQLEEFRAGDQKIWLSSHLCHFLALHWGAVTSPICFISKTPRPGVNSLPGIWSSDQVRERTEDKETS